MVNAQKFQVLRADLADDREKFIRSNFVSRRAGQRILRGKDGRDLAVAASQQATAFVNRIGARYFQHLLKRDARDATVPFHANNSNALMVRAKTNGPDSHSRTEPVEPFAQVYQTIRIAKLRYALCALRRRKVGTSRSSVCTS